MEEKEDKENEKQHQTMSLFNTIEMYNQNINPNWQWWSVYCSSELPLLNQENQFDVAMNAETYWLEVLSVLNILLIRDFNMISFTIFSNHVLFHGIIYGIK